MSFRSFILAGAVALASLGGAGRALAESRIALVIGNSAYQSVPQLPNPTNDARHMAEFLKSARFEVITARDLTQNEMRRTIGEFARKVANQGRTRSRSSIMAGTACRSTATTTSFRSTPTSSRKRTCRCKPCGSPT
jgi:hypothetical protein